MEFKDFFRKLNSNISKWIDGDITLIDADKFIKNRKSLDDFDWSSYFDFYKLREHKRIYNFICITCALIFIFVMLRMVNELPRFGEISNPVHNEIMERYINDGVEETGSLNYVTGMILEYRAFDTFGEIYVLFLSIIASIILLKKDHDNVFLSEEKELQEDEGVIRSERDAMLQVGAKYICPMIFLYGIYITFTGHLSSGGGFAGGVTIGAGLIFYAMAFGRKKVQKFFKMRTFTILNSGALLFYFFCKAFIFFTGGNGIEVSINKGEAGKILSGGFILPLNISVAVVVACSIYGLYALFTKGDI